MSDLQVELCPETGICSIIKEGGAKVDLMPDEVEAIRQAGADAGKIKEIIAASDEAFAGDLKTGEISRILSSL